ncbi:glycoside hydrolase family 1 protein [Brevibacterium aurantiacum]|uniref:beta-glucosidase n=1 Tax=Brevibacterium aurantiacum TaxID=273384 RepID=A0A1D7W4F2_BREAU|nr:family 1 glycosylhydrolase [Brevibacterium aurantiacum]AOP53538.1 Beta-galactosidase [Brevibacterium aurantiacum]RCS96915.1 beta-glucosidase [Brevibacterium aurantiacum]
MAVTPEFAPRALQTLSGLRFSTATSAFQIEGARTLDGRGRSIWDEFVDEPGNVIDSSTADPGPDSYHRSAEDAALLAGLGVDRYRFSISWVPIIADGMAGTKPNTAGLDYYDRVVDELLGVGVTPEPTLYHWDLPTALEAAGGWLNRDTVHRFGDYVDAVADRLGDRVRHWYTINEPASTSLQGYALGELAPGHTMLFDALPTVHHQLLAHGTATTILREHGAEQVAPAINHSLILPETDTEADHEAAATLDLIYNRLFADPLLLGEYPDLEALGAQMPIRDGDMELISTPCDVYGFNYYNPTTVRGVGEGPLPFEMVPTPGAATTGFGPLWPIRPDTLRDFLIDMRTRYGSKLPPIVISENGASFPEPEVGTEPIRDDERIAYLHEHLEAVAEAIVAGVAIVGYTVWSLLDNFEWADGYTQRFGLVHVDMNTGHRTPKSSYQWYRDLIASVRA